MRPILSAVAFAALLCHTAAAAPAPVAPAAAPASPPAARPAAAPASTPAAGATAAKPAARPAAEPGDTADAAATLKLPCRPSNRSLKAGLGSFRDCAGAPEMIGLRGGKFTMGDTVGDGQFYERPVREVQVGPFALGRFEVTRAEWAVCVAAGACAALTLPGGSAYARYPAAGLSWTQASEYATWLSARTGKSYRLPSEAEWEYAARAGYDGRYPWGSFMANACAFVNIADAKARALHPEWTWADTCEDGFAEAAPVGSFGANDWGFHDLLGNVWEWTADCWHADYTGAPADGRAWVEDGCRKRVNRGGGFGNNLRAARLSSRDGDPASARSEGLGFRIARTLTVAEIPGGIEAAPDAKPREEPPVIDLRKRGTMSAPPPAPAVPVLPPPATSLALERALELHIVAKGKQHWENVLQHTDGTTEQEYHVSTRLRSDGVLYGDNLLDADPARRQYVKRQYLARQGLIRIKKENGGKLPRTAEEFDAMMKKVQESVRACGLDVSTGCGTDAALKMAAIDALRENPVADLEALLARPATGMAARWLYFFGYDGCPITTSMAQETHLAGERAYDHEHKKLIPWSLDRSARANEDSTTARDRVALCDRYVITVDIRTGKIYVENVYLPSPFGTTIRRMNKRVENLTEEMPVIAELLSWLQTNMRELGETRSVSTVIPLYLALDGDSTVLGHFEGNLDTQIEWSFKPVPGAPETQVPLN